jgi:CubicO group peptidase (beta-lactamase class C family)
MTSPSNARRSFRRGAIVPIALAAALAGCARPAHTGPAHTGPATRTAATSLATAATWRPFNQWLTAQTAAGQFSGAALVAHGHQVLLNAGYGAADRATGTANTAATTFCIASIGKLFTAVAIAQLVQEHRLSFGATVGRYLTGFAPAVADHVTVADLLDMTAGLGNAALAGPHPPVTLAGQLQLIAAEPPPARPGSAFLYSNDDYIVLGAIIERVAAQSYPAYVQDHVLDPAGMTHTRLLPYTPAAVPGMAHGYAATSTGLADVSDQPQVANPSGGAASTTGDLLRFARAVLGHRLLDPAMTAVVLTPRVSAPQPGGPPVDEYTYGFAYQAINGVTFVGHNGGTPGYEGQLDIYPATGYVVAILTNTDRTLVPAIQRSEAILTR